jgi:hypothetical protein
MVIFYGTALTVKSLRGQTHLNSPH